jgi:ribosomal-protein-serine acetyltransferase
MKPEGIDIRLITKDDAVAFYELIEKNRERLTMYFPKTLKHIRDLDSTKLFINLKINEATKKDGYWFLVISKKENQLIGSLVIKDLDLTVPKCELAYFIDESFEGKGITSKATQWLVNHCFNELGMEKIILRINPANEASRRVALKNGFTREGYMKKEYRNGFGELTDVEHYGLVRNVD